MDVDFSFTKLHIFMTRFDVRYLLSLEWIIGQMVKLENALSLN